MASYDRIDQSMYELVGKFVAESYEDMDQGRVLFLYDIFKDEDNCMRPWVIAADRVRQDDWAVFGLANSSKRKYFQVTQPTLRMKRNVIDNLFYAYS